MDKPKSIILILPDRDMRIFSIFKSGMIESVNVSIHNISLARAEANFLIIFTSVYNGISMTVIYKGRERLSFVSMILRSEVAGLSSLSKSIPKALTI